MLCSLGLFEIYQKQNKCLFRLTDEDVILPSFFAQYGYRNKLCATDVAYVIASVLENTVSKLE